MTAPGENTQNKILHFIYIFINGTKLVLGISSLTHLIEISSRGRTKDTIDDKKKQKTIKQMKVNTVVDKEGVVCSV